MSNIKYLVNPTGKFVIGGPHGIVISEAVNNITIDDTVVHISYLEIVVAYKLMARIQISCGCYCQIFSSYTASADALIDARATGQINCIVTL